jgi:retron-type reverse transcriptase
LDWKSRRTTVNTDASDLDLIEAEDRVLQIQTKLHQWATDDPDRRFDDLFNLVCDPAFLMVAWDRVRGNRGARSAGVDGVAPRSILFGRDTLLPMLREDLKARRFAPMPVREKLIPKKGGKLRGLGIPTARDRCVQASLKLVLEPIFEADFEPCSYGFRPKRRAQDAIEEIFGSSAGLVGHEAQGSFGAMPARSSMIMVMKLSGSWKPRAAERIRPMAALFDSEMPLVSFHSIVASMEVR